MKYLSIIAFFFLLVPFQIKSQIILTIEIKDLENSTGSVLLELRDENDNIVKGFTKKITDKSCLINIENLKPGKYSFKYFHDENNNKKLDTNLFGIPKEGFGFSNNAKGRFGPPAFDKTIFGLKGNTLQKCTLQYY